MRRCSSWKNGKHTQQWLKTLELYTYPKLGKLTVDKIDGPMFRNLAEDPRDGQACAPAHRLGARLVLFQRLSR
jgi:hypothetical protein